MGTLYDINGELLELLAARPELDEEAFKDTWESLQLERAEKIENVCAYIKEQQALAAACKGEADVLAERARVYANRAKSLTGYLQMQLDEREKYESARHKLQWRSSTSVEVSCNPQLLPEQYQRLTVAADKTALKQALSAGERIDGCELKTKVNLGVK
jgi:hypothetical protein